MNGASIMDITDVGMMNAMDEIMKSKIKKAAIEIKIRINTKENQIPIMESVYELGDKVNLLHIAMAISELEKMKLIFIEKYDPDIEITNDEEEE